MKIISYFSTAVLMQLICHLLAFCERGDTFSFRYIETYIVAFAVFFYLMFKTWNIFDNGNEQG